MTEKELIDYCLTYEAAFLDYPFDETTAVIKHSVNKKMFALVSRHHGRVHISLKCDPLKAEILRENYNSVEPAYHMNKKHWNMVYMEDGDDVSLEELYDMVSDSYDLVKPKIRKKKEVK